jgi:hypothetical protein
MARRKRKTVSFDAMVKFFIRNYDIPTRKDIDVLNHRLEKIEKLIMLQPMTRRSAGMAKKQAEDPGIKGRSAVAASDEVLNIMKNDKKGLNFAEIKAKTGYEEKKLRNIIFRLHSTHRIKRVSRGVYIAAE